MSSPAPTKTGSDGADASAPGKESFLKRTFSKLKTKRSSSKLTSTTAGTTPGAEVAKTPAAKGTDEIRAETSQAPEMAAIAEKTGVTQANATLESLLAANKRYAEDAELQDEPHPPAPLELRKELASKGQKPVATVIACADSRVPPELLFRGTVGSLFVLRTAGNVTDDEAVLASVEYAVAVLKTPLVLVMGHELCGAVKASVSYTTDDSFGASLPKHLSKHVGKMAACLPDMESLSGLTEAATTTACVEAHTKAAAAALPIASEVVGGALKSGDVLVVPAVYDIESGLVRVLE